MKLVDKGNLSCDGCDALGVMYIGQSPCSSCSRNPKFTKQLTDKYKNEKKTTTLTLPCSSCNGTG
jgi:hypothetical protein